MTELSHQFVDMPWTPALVIEDALGLFADDELCMRHNITLGTLTSLRVLPGYEAAKRNAREEIVEKNLTFKYKARLQAEQGLSLAWKWMNDPEAPVKDKLAVLKELTNWGELAPKETAGAGNGFTFVVNLPGVGQQTLTIDVPKAPPIEQAVDNSDIIEGA